MTKPPLWPLWALCLSVPLTWGVMFQYLVGLDVMWVSVLSTWVALLFCYAHRLVYFYHVRQASKWVYFVAMPWVLLLYPTLFLCLMFVVAMQTPAF